MGRTFLEHHVPRLVAALEALGRPVEYETVVTVTQTRVLEPPAGGGWRARQLAFDPSGALVVLWERPKPSR